MKDLRSDSDVSHFFYRVCVMQCTTIQEESLMQKFAVKLFKDIKIKIRVFLVYVFLSLFAITFEISCLKCQNKAFMINSKCVLLCLMPLVAYFMQFGNRIFDIFLPYFLFLFLQECCLASTVKNNSFHREVMHTLHRA